MLVVEAGKELPETLRLLGEYLELSGQSSLEQIALRLGGSHRLTDLTSI